MDYVLLFASVVLEMIYSGLIRNSFSKTSVKTSADLYCFNTMSAAVTILCLLALYLVTGTLRAPSLYTVLMALAFGIVTALQAIFDMKALSCGPMSFTKLIICSSMVVPSLSGAVFYGEAIGTLQYVGIALMLVSFFFAVEPKNDTGKANLKWFLLCMAAFCMTGAIGVMQKVHQSSDYADEISAFLLISFGMSIASSALMVGISKKRYHASVTFFREGKGRKAILYALGCGFGVAFCNHYNLYLAGVIDSIILFPILNGGALFLMMAAGFVIWKEKLSKRQTIGIVIGVISMLLLCNVTDFIAKLFA